MSQERPRDEATTAALQLAAHVRSLDEAGPLWWLSFCDPSRPKGQQLLGVSIVQATDSAAAVAKAHRLGCNPGGEVALWSLPIGAAFIPAEMIGRLVPPAEVPAFDAAIWHLVDGH